MLPFRRIIFPVDFSDRCRAIAPKVRETAERFGADLILVNAVDPVPLVVGSFEASVAMPVADFGEIHRRQEARLKAFDQEMFAGMKPTLLVEDGEAGGVVSNTIRRHGADLVMLPTHGHGAVRRWLLGSVTAKVLHDASCAVWTDAHGTDATAKFPYRRVLCALRLDDEETEAVLRAAASIAQKYQAELLIMHAVEIPPAAWEMDFAPYKKAILDAADAKMRQIRHATGIEAPFEIVEGRAAEEIRRIARDKQADLVVTGRGHAQGGLSRAWSQLYSIIREAPCPVLSV